MITSNQYLANLPQEAGGILPSNQRPSTKRKPTNKRKDGRVPRVIFQRDSIGENDLAQIIDSRSTDTLQGPTEKQHGPCLRRRAEHASNEHEEDGKLENVMAAKDVGELAKGRDECGGGEGVGDDDPVELVELV